MMRKMVLVGQPDASFSQILGTSGTQMHTGTAGAPGSSEGHGWRDPSGLQGTNLPFVLASHFLF